MARDVEFNVTASDKTGTALAAAEAKFKASQERIRRESKKTGKGVGDDLLGGADRAGKGMLSRLLPQFSELGASGGQLLGAGLAAAAPLIGATISAAIIGGAGVGGVLGGVALAARDPRVKAAGTQLGKTLLDDLTKDASSFVEPVLDSIAKIEARFGQMNGRIKSIFDHSAGFLGPLVDAAADGVDGILRGFDALVRRGKPVMDALGNSITIIGDSIGDALEVISGDSQDAAKGLETLAGAIGGAIKIGGYLIRGLTELYGVITFLPSKIGDASNAFGRLIGIYQSTDAETKTIAGTATELAVKIRGVADAATAAAPPVRDLDKEFADAAASARSLYGATTDLAGAVAAATATINENGRGLSLNSKSGRENRQALADVAAAMVRQHDAAVAANGENVKSAGISDRNRDAFIQLAIKAGYSAQKARDLATSLGLIPTRRETQIKADTAKAEAAAKRVRTLLAQVRSKQISVDVLVNDARLRSVENRLSRLPANYGAADMSWAGVDRSSGTARTGGAAPINLTSDVRVSLDGRPFYAATVSAVQASERRSAWRARVGARSKASVL